MVKSRAPRRGRKPSLKKAAAVVSKNRVKKAKQNMDTFFLKTKTLLTLTPAQGVSVSNYIYGGFVMNPGAGTNFYTNNAEFNLYKLQYDKFRVNSVKLIVRPKANVLDQTNAQNDSNFTLTGDGMIHTCIDRDGLAPSSISVISRYPSYKKYRVDKPFSRSYAIKYPTGVWLDCDDPATFSMSKELGLTGGITIYAEDLLEDSREVFNEPWAEVEVQYNIVFQGKTSNKLTGVYNELSELVGVCINKVDVNIMRPLTEPQGIRGTLDADVQIGQDASGNALLIPVNDETVPQPPSAGYVAPEY